MRFSIIVPVYNVQDYLRECIDSILAQTYLDYELILIDDGSTDKSGEMCDDYATHNLNIKVIHRVNGGLSAARNTGIDAAGGDYLVFIDSDDYIAINSLDEISKSIGEGQCDVVITRLIQKYPDAEEIKNNSINQLSSDINEEIINWVFCGSENTWPAPQYIVSKEFIRKKNLRFAEGYLHEDLAWTVALMATSEKFAVCTFPWYYHRMQRAGSITTTSKPKRVVDVISLSAMSLEYMNQQNVEEQKKKIIANRIFLSVSSIMNQYAIADRNGKNMICNALSENLQMFYQFDSVKGKLFFFSLRTFGTRITLECFAKAQQLVHELRGIGK